MLGPLLKFLFTLFVVTNRRVIIKYGFISRLSQELLLHDIGVVQVKQGILGRILGYGTVTFVGVQPQPFRGISAPMALRRHVDYQRSLITG